MLNPLSFISKIFKSSNDIELAKFKKFWKKLILLKLMWLKLKMLNFQTKLMN